MKFKANKIYVMVRETRTKAELQDLAQQTMKNTYV